MSVLDSHDMYSQIPLLSGNVVNRTENMIIDVLGNWIPECSLIYYGLMNSDYSEELYKLKNIKVMNPHDIYLDHFFFTGDDLIRYLYSDTDDLVDLSEEYLLKATETALSRYFYVPCEETMLRHSIIELAYYDWVKSITLIYPWEIRSLDYTYLSKIIPKTVASKFNLVSGTIPEFLYEKRLSDTRYTTIIMNSLDELNLLIDDAKTYNVDSSFFLLRNHSGNVIYNITTNESGERDITFTEVGTQDILNKLIDPKTFLPITQMRFARYQPLLFKDMKPDSSKFYDGSDIRNKKEEK